MNPSTPLPNGLSFGLRQGSFDQYELSGQLNQTVTQTTAWEVEINTTGGNCNQASQTISFILSPQPEITLTSQANTANQTICDGEAINDIEYALGGGTENVIFSWTSGASNVLGLTASLNASRTAFTITGTPSMNISQTTVFAYQIESVNSVCSTEVIQVDQLPCSYNQ